MADERFLNVIIVPDEGRAESRTLRWSHRRLRVFLLLASFSGVVGLVMLSSWWYLAARALRTSELEDEVAALTEERAGFVQLESQLELLEAEYEKIRGLFGIDAPTVPSSMWLPPTSSPPAPSRSLGESESLPTSWPLSTRGFVTQPLLEGAQGEHPGLDIAVPTDSYIRAAGAGTVVDVGEDEVYGRFVVLDHGDGYRSRYAHASQTLAEMDQVVRRREVIALSGSTGRSTAPHLHFEILRDGEALDPLTMVRQP